MDSRPALLGGKPIIEGELPPENTVGGEEIAAVTRVLEGGELSGFLASAGDEFFGGKEVRKLEEDFRKRFDVKHAIGLNSATTGLHAALVACGVGAGDQVILPPTTMSATAAAVLLAGAVPVFADIDPLTFNIDPTSVESRITDRTAAIIAVNLFGQPAALDELRRIADAHRLRLIEDNAQAPAALFDGRWAGTIGDAGVFSLNRNKIVQSGEGGVVVTNDDNIAFRAQLVRNHGEVVLDQMKARPYEPLVGSNYRLTEPIAAIANVQMSRLDKLTADRVALAEQLTEGLSGIDCLQPPTIHPKATHVYFVYPMRFDAEAAGMPRDLFVKAMTAENLPLFGGYVKPIYLYPVFQHKPDKRVPALFGQPLPDYSVGICPNAERAHSHDLVLTDICRYPLRSEHIELFIQGVEKVLGAAKELVKSAAES